LFDTVAYPFYDAKREKWDAFEAEPKSTVRSDCATGREPQDPGTDSVPGAPGWRDPGTDLKVGHYKNEGRRRRAGVRVVGAKLC